MLNNLINAENKWVYKIAGDLTALAVGILIGAFIKHLLF